MKDFTVTITDPARAAEWQSVLGTTTVCVLSPVPIRANLPGKGDSLIYELDLESLTPEQRSNLLSHLCQKFNVPPEEGRRLMIEQGIPILAEHCSVAVRNPQRWF